MRPRHNSGEKATSIRWMRSALHMLTQRLANGDQTVWLLSSGVSACRSAGLRSIESPDRPECEGLFTQKNPRTPPKKIRKKSKKSKDFFEDLKSVYLIWEWTTTRFQCLNPFLFINSSYTQKNPKKSEKNRKNPKKIKKNPKKSEKKIIRKNNKKSKKKRKNKFKIRKNPKKTRKIQKN